MKARLLSGGLLLAALAVHVALTMPLQRRAAAAGDEYRHLRDDRRRAESKLGRLERGERLRRRAQALFADSRGGSEDVVRQVRRSVVGSLEGSSVSRVRIGVRPDSRATVAASVMVNAEGSFDDVVRLSARLARADTGLVLQTVAFQARSPLVGLALEAVGPGGPS